MARQLFFSRIWEPIQCDLRLHFSTLEAPILSYYTGVIILSQLKKVEPISQIEKMKKLQALFDFASNRSGILRCTLILKLWRGGCMLRVDLFGHHAFCSNAFVHCNLLHCALGDGQAESQPGQTLHKEGVPTLVEKGH